MLTVTVPTRNRAPYLERLLSYLADQGLTYPVFIGDSSDAEHRDRVARLIQRLTGRIQAQQILCPYHEGDAPGMGTIECMSDLLKRVKTPYAVLLADDDFIVPSALQEAVDFLESYPDYSVVQGQSATFQIAGQAHGPILSVGPYWQQSVEDPSPSQRLHQALRRNSGTEFSVKRTAHMVEAWQAVKTLALDNYFGEMLVNGLAVLRGKVRMLDRLYMVRQSHPVMTSLRSPDPFDWVTHPDWALQYARFRDHLTRTLTQVEAISLDQARATVKDGFWSYLSSGLEHEPAYSPWTRLYRMTAQHIPGLLKVWRKLNVNRWIPRSRREMSLPALLKRTSFYHTDFIPIYRAITIPVQDISVDRDIQIQYVH